MEPIITKSPQRSKTLTDAKIYEQARELLPHAYLTNAGKTYGFDGATARRIMRGYFNLSDTKAVDFRREVMAEVSRLAKIATELNEVAEQTLSLSPAKIA